METASVSPDPSQNLQPTTPLEFLDEHQRVLQESDAALLHARELSAHGAKLTESVRHLGHSITGLEAVLDTHTDLIDSANRLEADALAPAEADRGVLQERAGEAMTNLYETLLEAGRAHPDQDYYSKNAWFEYADPDHYAGPVLPTAQPTRLPKNPTREQVHEYNEEVEAYNGQVRRYDSNVRKSEHTFPYIDIDGVNPKDKKQPVLEFLKARGIKYEATWRLANKQHKTNTKGGVMFSVDADVVHTFTFKDKEKDKKEDEYTGLTIEVAYGGFRSNQYRDTERTPQVTVRDASGELHFGEEAWDQVPGLAPLLGVLRTGGHYEKKIPSTMTERIRDDWVNAFQGITDGIQPYFSRKYKDQAVSTAEFEKLKDTMLHNLNRNHPEDGWTLDGKLHRKNHAEHHAPDHAELPEPDNVNGLDRAVFMEALRRAREARQSEQDGAA